jgi:hypothetical protein
VLLRTALRVYRDKYPCGVDATDLAEKVVVSDCGGDNSSGEGEDEGEEEDEFSDWDEEEDDVPPACASRKGGGGVSEDVVAMHREMDSLLSHLIT